MATEGGPNIVVDGLQLYLDPANPKSYPGSGNTLNDLTINQNHTNLLNGATTSNTSEQSIVTDGAGDEVVVSSPTLDFNSELTLECWVKVEHTGNYGGLFRQNQGLGGYGLSIRGSDGYIVHYIGASSSTVGGWWAISRFNNLLQGPSDWHHICSVSNLAISGSTNRWFYIDGELRATNTQAFTTTQVPYNTNEIDVVNVAFGGKVGIPRIYNKALTQEEVLQNYNATKSRFNL
jgi:hypothetical protein